MTSEPIFRIDKFVVPAASEAAFLARVRATHAILGKQPGCLINLVLKVSEGASVFNYMTLVSWDSNEALAQARQVMAKRQADEGFDTTTFFNRLGIRADISSYRALDLALIPA